MRFYGLCNWTLEQYKEEKTLERFDTSEKYKELRSKKLLEIRSDMVCTKS